VKNLRILVPLDGSKNSERTVQTLLKMLAGNTGTLTLLHVLDHDRISFRGVPSVNYDQVTERARIAARKFIEEQRERFAAAGVNARALLKEGPARKTICAEADSGDYDLMIIGRHTDGELKNLLFGQVSNYVIHNVKNPVMIL
jgi:nucleotide-binding universal stress UspA family protein